MRDTGVCDSAHCTLDKAAVVFLEVNLESSVPKSARVIDQAHFAAEKSRPFRRPDLNDENDDHALMRFEFLEALVRVAVLKYGRTHPHEPGDEGTSLAAGSVVSGVGVASTAVNRA